MRALVLSGGGSRGAFQVGVLQHLICDLGRDYESYCGISVGAINSVHLAMYSSGMRKVGAQMLKELWLDLDAPQVYKKWFLFRELAALWKPSVYNTEPLADMLYKQVDLHRIKLAKRKLRVGAVSLTTGKYRIFDEDYEDLAGAVLASSAFPVMFTPVELEGEWWTDGGARDITPLKCAIDLGADVIDVILTSTKNMPKTYPENAKAIDYGARTLSIMTDEIMENDVKIALLINELVMCGKSNKKNVEINIYRPAQRLPGNSLDFSPADIREMIKHGYEVAREQ